MRTLLTIAALVAFGLSNHVLAQQISSPSQEVSITVTKDESFCQGQTAVILKNSNVSSRVVATIRAEPNKVLPELIFDRFFNQLSSLRLPKTYPELLLPGEQKILSCGANGLPDGKSQFSILGAYYPLASLDLLELSQPEDSIVLKINNSQQALQYCSHSSLKVPAATGVYEAVNIHRRHRVTLRVSNKTDKSFNGTISIDPMESKTIACDNEVIVKNVKLDEFAFLRYQP